MSKIIEKWGERISTAIADKNMSVMELARNSGIKRDTIYAYISGASTPSGGKLLRIANAVGVSLDWLAGRPGAARQYGDKHMLESVSAGIEEATGLIPIPLYEVEAGAGNIKIVEAEDTDTWLWISRAWAQRYGKSNLVIIKVSGDSMVPAIEPGSLMLLNLADKRRDSGIRVIRMEDGLTVKRCDPRPKGALRMTSENPAHEPFTAKAGDYEIIGAVLATIKIWE